MDKETTESEFSHEDSKIDAHGSSSRLAITLQNASQSKDVDSDMKFIAGNSKVDSEGRLKTTPISFALMSLR